MSIWPVTHLREKLPGPGKQREFCSVFVHSRDLFSFELAWDHPFKPERVYKTVELCGRYGVWERSWMRVVAPVKVQEEELLGFHHPSYIRVLKEASEGRISLETLQKGLGTHECPVVPGLYDWACGIVGGTLGAMRAILAGEADVAVNFYGGLHHGMPDHAEGFCYLNDIAVSVPEALKRGWKVAYVDCDAHHGNGVQEAFYKDPRVLVISIHETGRTLYPWDGWETQLGEGEGYGYNVNLPLEPGSDDEVFQLAFDSVVLPLLEAFDPDLIVAQLGADSLISDPLTHLRLTNNGYSHALRCMAGLGRPILALGGGGYDMYRTARWWTLAWAILNDLEPKDELAGLVGGMMFGPEMEVGSLLDAPHPSEGEIKDRAMEEARRVVAFLEEKLFPIHGISKGGKPQDMIEGQWTQRPLAQEEHEA
ncbi:MAG: acetoin utilization protein AcuC [bacterium]